MFYKICLTLTLLTLLAGPADAQQLTFKVGADVTGTYHASGITQARLGPGAIGDAEIDLSVATSSGFMIGAEFVGGNFWQVGLGVEQLFPRPIDGHDGSFSFTTFYATTRLQLSGLVTPSLAARLGWTLSHSDETFKEPAYSAIPIELVHEDVRVLLRGGFNYGVNLGLARGPVRVEVAYLTYLGTRLVRRNGLLRDDTKRLVDLDIRYTTFNILLGYTIRLSQ